MSVELAQPGELWSVVASDGHDLGKMLVGLSTKDRVTGFPAFVEDELSFAPGLVAHYDGADQQEKSLTFYPNLGTTFAATLLKEKIATVISADKMLLTLWVVNNGVRTPFAQASGLPSIEELKAFHDAWELYSE